MAPDAVALGQRADCHDIVDDAIGEVGCTAHQQHRIRIDGALHGMDVHLACDAVHGDAANGHAKVVGRLVKGHMSARRSHDLGVRDASLSTAPFPHGQACHHDRLRAAGCRRACGACRGMEHGQDHRHDLRLHFAQTWEHFGVQRIRQEEALEGRERHAIQFFAAMVHGARHLAIQVHTAPIRLAVRAQTLQRIELCLDPRRVATMRRQLAHRGHRRRRHERLGDIAHGRSHLALDALAIRGNEHHEAEHAQQHGVLR